MNRVQFSEQPERILYMKNKGKADVWLRKNITEVTTEEGTLWEADEVYVSTYLSREEIAQQFDSYFEEEIPITVEDLAEALDILTNIILEG